MSTIENAIATFWKDILELKENINGLDNFFHLGGNSIHAIHLQHFVNKKFNVDVTFRNIFENQTIESLARVIESKMSPVHQMIKDDQNDAETLQADVFSEGDSDNLQGVELLITKPISKKRHENSNRRLLPVTFGEESLWLADQLLENKSVYNQIKAFRIAGTLNKKLLQQSLEQLTEYHENLRKQFVDVEGSLRSWFDHTSEFKLKQLYARNFDLQEFEELSAQILVSEANTPFDLGNDLPFRATLVEFENEFLLILTAHHIVCDEWSFDILKKDLARFYNAALREEYISRPSLSNKYVLYPAQERQSLNNEKQQELLDFWLSNLQGKFERLRLPYDRRIVRNSSAEGSKESIQIPPELIDAIEKLSREKGVTLFMTFLAAFHTLLHRYTNNENIITGVPFANRGHEDTRQLVGFFVNTVLISTSFRDDPDFTTFLNKVRESVMEISSHQTMPFEILADSIRKKTRINASDIIQVMFAFQNITESDLELDGVAVQYVEPHSTSAKYELVVEVLDLNKAGYRISIEYRKSLFNRSTIQRMLNHFLVLLQSIVNYPNRKVRNLNMTTEYEREVIVEKWNNTSREIPSSTIHELFELQAEAYPERDALSYNDRILSYAELNVKANQLATYLIKLGVTPGDLVGVLMDETENAIISFLAILKAGCAYVPLDPTYPVDRINYMLQDSRTPLVITVQKYQSIIKDTEVKSIILDEQINDIFSDNLDNLNRGTNPSHLAYVIYTSGSTGKPKGVAIEHKGVVRLLMNTDWVTLNNRTRLLKTSAFSFDVSVMEIWGTLLHGGRLFLYSREDLFDPKFLKQKIEQNKINTFNIASAWLNQLIEIDTQIFKSLKTLIGGGDKLSAKHINKLLKDNPDLQVINAYGPTENSVWSTSCKLSGEQIEPVLIGKPIPNSTAYILNESMQLQPIGVVGEICVGGVGVARGYLNNEEKTKERFVDDPFSPPGRLYKTGDLGRWLEDGNIEFHGRGDNQIKLRGFRIELGEIEQVVTTHPQIVEAVVLLSGNQDKDKRLICYYTGSKEFTNESLKTFLEKSLPEYMIPSKFIYLQNLPITTNGKVNRLALQEFKLNEN